MTVIISIVFVPNSYSPAAITPTVAFPLAESKTDRKRPFPLEILVCFKHTVCFLLFCFIFFAKVKLFPLCYKVGNVLFYLSDPVFVERLILFIS